MVRTASGVGVHLLVEEGLAAGEVSHHYAVTRISHSAILEPVMFSSSHLTQTTFWPDRSSFATMEARRPMMCPRQSITTSFSNISTTAVRTVTPNAPTHSRINGQQYAHTLMNYHTNPLKTTTARDKTGQCGIPDYQGCLDAQSERGKQMKKSPQYCVARDHEALLGSFWGGVVPCPSLASIRCPFASARLEIHNAPPFQCRWSVLEMTQP